MTAAMSLIQRAEPYPHWEFTAASGDQLRLVPERGGLITAWRCGGVERLYFDADRFADPALSVRGGIPILFPVCGNLPGNQLVLPQGSTVMAQHGFARDRPWSLTPLADGQGVRLELRDDAASRAVYPFPFLLALEVRLEPQALAIRAVVEHRDDAQNRQGGPAAATAVMPFALGLHPYFAVADLAAAGLAGLPPRCFDHLTAADTDTAGQLQRLSQGVDLRVDLERSGESGDAAASAGSAAPSAAPPPPPLLRTGLPLQAGSAQPASLVLEAVSPFAHAVVWTDPPRPMVCLEPWTDRRGALGLSLAPGQRCELACRYALVAG